MHSRRYVNEQFACAGRARDIAGGADLALAADGAFAEAGTIEAANATREKDMATAIDFMAVILGLGFQSVAVHRTGLSN